MITALVYGLAWLAVAILGYDLFAKPLAWLGEAVGWAFYRRHMRSAERKMIRRELLRTQLDTAVMRYQQTQIEMTASLHQHAHTMAGLTGQPYLVTGEFILPVPQAGGSTSIHLASGPMYAAGGGHGGTSVDVHAEERTERLAVISDNPRYMPWAYR